MKTNKWRLIDTGLRSASENIALNKTLLQAHQQGDIPNTLRFLQFKPSALVGFHQNVYKELRLEYCDQQGIAVQRRITGGGAIYFDEMQLGWELYFNKRFFGSSEMHAIAQKICETAALAISALGVTAKFRPRNDIEVEGRKISGTGGVVDGDSVMYQGTLLLQFDIEKMLRVLKIPMVKLSDKAISSARDRVVNLYDLVPSKPTLSDIKASFVSEFSRTFALQLEEHEHLTSHEQTLFDEAIAEISSAEWVYGNNTPIEQDDLFYGEHKSPGGLIQAGVKLDHQHRRITQLLITGDFFVYPKRLIVDLEAALRDTKLDQLNINIELFFKDYLACHTVDMLMLTPGDFCKVIQNAVAS